VPLRIDGSPGVAPLVGALAEAYRAKYPGAPVQFASGMGSSARIKAVQDGQIDVAMASHGVDSADLAQRALTARPIAKTAVVFAVNAGVPITALTHEQVCGVYSGRITNWQALGAPSAPVRPAFRPPSEVDAEVALQGVPCLAALRFADAVRVIERPDDMARVLADSAGTIGVTSEAMVAASGGRIRSVTLNGVASTPENVASGAYPMTRGAILVFRNAPGPAVERFLSFVASDEGQRVIRENGAVPTTGGALPSIPSGP